MATDRTLDEIMAGFSVSSGQLGLPAPPAFMNMPTPMASQYIPPLQIPPPPPPTPIVQPPVMNWAAAQSHQMPMHHAQMMGGMNYPSPQMMTPAQYGVFRSGVAGPSQQSFNIPMGGSTLALATVPPPMPPPVFSLMSDMRMRHEADFARRMNVMDYAAMQGMARTMVAGAGAWVGGGLGALAGAPFGAAAFGANVGSVMGTFAGSSDTINSSLAWLLEPSLRRSAHGMRLREASESFMTMGGGLDVTGRGMSPTAAARMTRGLHSLSNDRFNETDVVNLTQLASESGILSMAQSGTQVIDSMKNVLVAVGSIAKMTGDPDVKNALRTIADMRNFGLSTPETMMLMQNSRAWARMAGTSVNTLLSQGGGVGAAIAQGAGLTAGTGVGLGAGNMGLAQAMIGSGATSVQQLSLLGGASGLQQQLTEAGVAAMTGNFGRMLLGSVVERGANGQLRISNDRLNVLMSSPSLGLRDIARAAGANTTPDIAQMLEQQSPELLDSLTRRLGSTGIMSLLNTVSRSNQSQFGLANQAGGLQMLGINPTLAGAMSRAFNNPQFIQGQLQQQRILSRELVMEQEAQLANMSGPLGQFFSETFGGMFAGRDALAPDLDMSMAEQQEQARMRASGFSVTRTPGAVGGPLGRGMIRRGLQSGNVSMGRTGPITSLSSIAATAADVTGLSGRALAQRRLRGEYAFYAFSGSTLRNDMRSAQRFATALTGGLDATGESANALTKTLVASTSKNTAQKAIAAATAAVEDTANYSIKMDSVGAVEEIRKGILDRLTGAEKQLVMARMEEDPTFVDKLISAGANAASPRTKAKMRRGLGRTNAQLRALGIEVGDRDLDSVMADIDNSAAALGRSIMGDAGNLDVPVGGDGMGVPTTWGKAGREDMLNATLGMSRVASIFNKPEEFAAFVMQNSETGGGMASVFMSQQGKDFRSGITSAVGKHGGLLTQHGAVIDRMGKTVDEMIARGASSDEVRAELSRWFRTATGLQAGRRVGEIRRFVQDKLKRPVGGSQRDILSAIRNNSGVVGIAPLANAIEGISDEGLALSMVSNKIGMEGSTMSESDTEGFALDGKSTPQTKMLETMLQTASTDRTSALMQLKAAELNMKAFEDFRSIINSPNFQKYFSESQQR